MSARPVLDLWLAKERIERELGEHQLRRMAMAARGPRRPSLRVSIGRQLIEIGHRLAADEARDVGGRPAHLDTLPPLVYSHHTTSHIHTRGSDHECHRPRSRR